MAPSLLSHKQKAIGFLGPFIPFQRGDVSLRKGIFSRYRLGKPNETQFRVPGLSQKRGSHQSNPLRVGILFPGSDRKICVSDNSSAPNMGSLSKELF